MITFMANKLRGCSFYIFYFRRCPPQGRRPSEPGVEMGHFLLLLFFVYIGMHIFLIEMKRFKVVK